MSEFAVEFPGRPLDELPAELRHDHEWYERHAKERKCWYCKEPYRPEECVSFFVGVDDKTYECFLHPVCLDLIRDPGRLFWIACPDPTTIHEGHCFTPLGDPDWPNAGGWHLVVKMRGTRMLVRQCLPSARPGF